MKKVILNVLASLFIISPAYAFNLSFLVYSPGYYFTKGDWKISEKTAQSALSNARDNSKVSWSNPSTGARGYFIPMNTTNQGGKKCRTLKIFSEAHKVTGQSVYQFCFVKGEWRVS